MQIPKITKEQAKSYALLVTPLIKQYIQSHPEEYTAYIKVKIEKTGAENRDNDNESSQNTY